MSKAHFLTDLVRNLLLTLVNPRTGQTPARFSCWSFFVCLPSRRLTQRLPTLPVSKCRLWSTRKLWLKFPTAYVSSSHCNISGFWANSHMQVSVGTAGVAVGPLLWLPVTAKIGRVAALFWGTVLAILCNIWSATMTREDQYNSFVTSRMFATIFSSVGTIVGSSFILEMFYLHQRGRAFAAYGIIMLSG
jgi:MFS family permease